MAQLQIPLNIWLAATPDERDGFYLSAGFDPNLPVIDNGTDTFFVRFRQDVAVGAVTTADIHVPQAGDDLRDFDTRTLPTGERVRLPVSEWDAMDAQRVSLLGITGDNPITDEMGVPVAVATAGMAGRALRLILGGGGGRLTAAIWNSLPSIVRTALTQIGIGIGAMVAFNGDIPFITLPGQGSSVPAVPIGPVQPPIDIHVGGGSPMQAAHVVGSWVANGVTFYRLADGKLAVQNKKGRWKVWKPKKPIVLYANGASNLKTMLRADKALNKQAKQIAAMLNRRAPKPRSRTTSAPSPIILGNNARVVDV